MAQGTLPEGGLGNLIALPMQGQALQKGAVRIVIGLRFRYQEFRFQPYKTCKDYGFTVYKSIHNRKSI